MKKTRAKPTVTREEVSDIQNASHLASYLGAQLRIAHRAALRSLEVDFAPYNSSPVRFAILDYLDYLKSCSQGSMAELLEVDRSTLVPIVAGMEQQGLIIRERDQSDRRVTRIAITAKGKKLLARLRPIAGNHDQRLRALMSEKELKLFLRLLRKITEHI